MDELVETLSLLQPTNILCILTRQAPQERVHVEVVEQAVLATLTRCRMHELAVGVEERSEATHKCCADELRSEGDRANQGDVTNASWMCADLAAVAGVDAIFTLFVAYRASCRILAWSKDHAMTLDPLCRLGVPNRLDQL